MTPAPRDGDTRSVDIAALRALLGKATPGTWAWEREGDTTKPYLVARPHCLIVMDFVRRGMQQATFRLARRSAQDRGGIMFEPTVDEAREHPDSALIVALVNAAPALLSEADAARAKALEEAAKVCDAQAERWVDFPAEHHRMETYIAAAHRIRALAAQDRAKETKNG